MQAHIDDRSVRFGRWGAILLGVSLPISTAVDNVLLLVIVVTWLFCGDWADKWQRLTASPPALAILGFVALAALGTSWGMGSAADRSYYLSKYADLLLAPLLITLPLAATDRRRALIAFVATLGVVLLISYALRLGIFPARWLSPLHTPENPWVFKRHITHGLFMAITCFIALVYALYAPSPALRRASAYAAVLTIVGVLMVDSRTAYVVMAALVAYLFVHCWRWRGVAAVGAVAVALSAMVMHMPIAPSIERFHQGIEEMRRWEYGDADRTSMGRRIQYAATSLQIVADHPVMGVGTGGFPTAYRSQSVSNGIDASSNNPHNQYLLAMAQFGVLGLVALLAIGTAVWRSSRHLVPPHRLIARGVLIAYALGCVFNSFLLDHAEGMFFAWIIGVLFSRAAQKTGNITPGHT